MQPFSVFLFTLWDSLVSWSQPWLPFGLGRRSNIPQFILDARHPWIEANRQELERTPDVAAYLCQVDPAFYIDNAIPPNLFQRLEINNNRAGIDRYGWGNALERLREIQSCPPALEGVETLDVDIFVHEGQEPENPSLDFVNLLADVLTSMPNLRAIVWDMPCKQTPLFGEAFTSRDLKLRSVRNLTAGPFSEYLVPLCPNLETVTYSPKAWHCDWHVRRERPCPRELLIKATTGNKDLTSFSMSVGSGIWSLDFLKEMLSAMPNLSHLAISGPLRVDGLGSSDERVLKRYLEVLARFTNLRHLELPGTDDLALGFYGWADCGNAYFGAQGREYGRRTAKESAMTAEKAGLIAIEALPDLVNLSIGGSEANVTRVDGAVELSWPWTGRMDEWAYDIFPDRDDREEL
ncbi:hypothetical protein MFIFM68171_09529 [Madurella fahalii]|uniref:Uncharacterized protein n=1 Tax=Madurella fahalii TaxID=1157608 RepID=A0ABQ0GNQ1_9PEZI